MKEEQYRLLALAGHLPARLTSEQAAWMLGCQAHDIPVLMALRLLRPLGNPAQNGIKYFATLDLTELTNDRQWLAKMTQAISQHWQRCNKRHKRACANAAGDDGVQTIRVTAKAA